MSQQRDVRKALERERDADHEEARGLEEIFNLEAGLADESRHAASLIALRDRVSRLAERAAKPDDSPDRRQARRMLRAVTAGAAARVQDPHYRALLEKYRLPGR